MKRKPGPRLMAVALLAAGLLVLAGCLQDFDPPIRIKGLRVLAMVAEPPTVQPAGKARITAHVVDAKGRDVSYDWWACPIEEGKYGFLDRGGRMQGTERSEGDCMGRPDSVHLEAWQDDQGQVHPEVVEVTAPSMEEYEELFNDLPEIAAAAGITSGEPMSEEQMARCWSALMEAGWIPHTVNVVVSIGEERVSAYKRLVVTLAWSNTNPELGEGVVDLKADEAGLDALPPGTKVDLHPRFDPETREQYVAVDWECEKVPRQESYYFSWFSSHGEISHKVSKDDHPQVEWHIPPASELGTIAELPLWVVVRDGRGGAAFHQTSFPVLK